MHLLVCLLAQCRELHAAVFERRVFHIRVGLENAPDWMSRGNVHHLCELLVLCHAPWVMDDQRSAYAIAFSLGATRSGTLQNGLSDVILSDVLCISN